LAAFKFAAGAEEAGAEEAAAEEAVAAIDYGLASNVTIAT